MNDVELKRRENCGMCGQSNWAEKRLSIALKALKDIKNLRGTIIPHSAGFEAGEIANKALDDIIFIRVKSEPVGASLSTTLGNCICGHGYASTCPVHGEPLQPDRGELMPLEQISGCIKDFTGGLPLREYLDEINEEDGFPRIAADELDAANIEGNKRGVQTSTLATSDPQLGASLSAQTPPELSKDSLERMSDILEHNHGLTSVCGIQQCSCQEAQDWRALKAHFAGHGMTVAMLADEVYALSQIVYFLCPEQGTTKDSLIRLRERMLEKCPFLMPGYVRSAR